MTTATVLVLLVGTPLLIAVTVLTHLARLPQGGRIPQQRTSRPNTRVVVSPSGVGLTRRIGPARVSTSGRGALRLGRVTGVFRWR